MVAQHRAFGLYRSVFLQLRTVTTSTVEWDVHRLSVSSAAPTPREDISAWPVGRVVDTEPRSVKRRENTHQVQFLETLDHSLLKEACSESHPFAHAASEVKKISAFSMKVGVLSEPCCGMLVGVLQFLCAGLAADTLGAVSEMVIGVGGVFAQCVASIPHDPAGSVADASVVLALSMLRISKQVQNPQRKVEASLPFLVSAVAKALPGFSKRSSQYRSSLYAEFAVEVCQTPCMISETEMFGELLRGFARHLVRKSEPPRGVQLLATLSKLYVKGEEKGGEWPALLVARRHAGVPQSFFEKLLFPAVLRCGKKAGREKESLSASDLRIVVHILKDLLTADCEGTSEYVTLSVQTKRLFKTHISHSPPQYLLRADLTSKVAEVLANLLRVRLREHLVCGEAALRGWEVGDYAALVALVALHEELHCKGMCLYLEVLLERVVVLCERRALRVEHSVTKVLFMADVANSSATSVHLARRLLCCLIPHLEGAPSVVLLSVARYACPLRAPGAEPPREVFFLPEGFLHNHSTQVGASLECNADLQHRMEASRDPRCCPLWVFQALARLVVLDETLLLLWVRCIVEPSAERGGKDEDDTLLTLLSAGVQGGLISEWCVRLAEEALRGEERTAAMHAFGAHPARLAASMTHALEVDAHSCVASASLLDSVVHLPAETLFAHLSNLADSGAWCTPFADPDDDAFGPAIMEELCLHECGMNIVLAVLVQEEAVQLVCCGDERVVSHLV